MRYLLIVSVVFGTWVHEGRSAALPSIYWSEAGGVTRARIDGADVLSVAPGYEIGGMALDRARQQMFFTDIQPRVPIAPTGVVNRGTVDGVGVVPIVAALAAPAALALDRNGRHVIWSDAESHSISIANYQGGDLKTILEPEPSIAQIAGLAFDPWKQQVYFSFVNPLIDSLRPGGIARMNLDGSDREVVVNGLVSPQGVAVDHIRGLIYWADPEFGNGLIGRAALDGSDPMKYSGGLGSPAGVAVDPYANQVYWADRGTGKIQTGTTFVPAVDLVTDRDQPNAVALLINSGLAGDTNDDGVVDIFDLNDVRNYFGREPGPGPGDANLDGQVDINDLNDVRNNFGSRFIPPDEANAVPEPNTAFLGIAGSAILFLLAARKRTSPTAAR